VDKYRVYGSKTKYYYLDINAEDAAEAWDLSLNKDNIEWFEVESDNVIEPYTVEEYSKLGPEFSVTRNI
jgi:hypothetical protein